MTQNFKDNTLYEMDNLVVLRGMNSERGQLILLLLIRLSILNETEKILPVSTLITGNGEIRANCLTSGNGTKFHPKWLEEIKDEHTALYQVIESTKIVQGEDTAAFLWFQLILLLLIRVNETRLPVSTLILEMGRYGQT